MMYFNIILLARSTFTEKKGLTEMLLTEWTVTYVCAKIITPTAQLIYFSYKSLSFVHNINTILMVHSCPFNLAPAIQRTNTPDNECSERRMRIDQTTNECL